MSTTIFLGAAQHERPKYFNASLQWSKYISLESKWSTRWSWFEEEVVLWIFIFAKNNIVISPLSVCKTISPKVMMRLRGRQLQLEGTPYSSVMTSANSNITRSGLPLKEKTSFLLNKLKKNNHLRQITLQLSFFSHHACEKSNTLRRPPLCPVKTFPLSV